MDLKLAKKVNLWRLKVNKKQLIETRPVKGWTERRLFDTPKFFTLLEEAGVKLPIQVKYDNSFVAAFEIAQKTLSKEVLDGILDKAAKPMFAGNFLWSLLKRFFNIDLAIAGLTGVWTIKAIKTNLVTTVGKGIIAGQVNGVTTAPVTAIAIGVGTTAANAADTTLESESTTNGGARGAATCTRQTTTTTNDTSRWVKTFTFTGSLAVTEEGLLDNNTSGGNLLARQVFAAVNVVDTDTLQITHNIKYS